MKSSSKLYKWFPSVVVGLFLAGSSALSLAQTNLVLDTFPVSDGTASGWSHDWGNAGGTAEFDGTMDADGKSDSGALKITSNYDIGLYGGGNDDAFQKFIGSNIDLTLYTNLHYDVYVDTNSAHLSGWGAGQLGNMNWYARDPSWAFVNLSDTIPWINADNYGKWKHWIQPINPLKMIIGGTNNVGANVARLGYQMWSGWDGVGLTNTVVYWIDNLWLEYNANNIIPPPTLSLKPNPSNGGLMISSSSGQYDRNSIATDTTANDYSWVGGGSTPVKYALTITNFPGPAYAGFQAHIFLCPNPGTEASPDWNQPNIVFLDIQCMSNGVAHAYFRYKTNEAGGNTLLYGKGTLTEVVCTNGPLGTWSISFLNDTNITVAAPDGTSTNINFPDVDAIQSLFGSGVVAYFGDQPNQIWNEGQFATFSRVQITGTPRAPAIDDTFPGPDINQDPAKVNWQWVLRAADATGIQVIGSDTVFSLSWTMPDFGYTVQSSANITGPWKDAGLSNIVNKGSSKSVFINRSALPGQDGGYFRMAKPLATKLQVLLPGETAAPGTTTGKTGTPEAQMAGVPFNITVNAVDDKWNVITWVTDKVNITSTDTAATLPADSNLAGGSQSVIVTLTTLGSFTFTAKDITDSKVAAGTSSSVTAQ